MNADEIKAELTAFRDRYGPAAGEDGPFRFALEVLGATLEPNKYNTLDPWQQDVLKAFGRRERGISIAACHGPGKTWVAAACVVCQMTTCFPQNVFATAPSKGQLEDALIAEIIRMFKKLPPWLCELYDIKKYRITLKGQEESSFFSAATARAEAPEALQGKHEKYTFLLGDEASAIPEAVFDSALGSMSTPGAVTMLLSNPTRSTGYFFDTHHKLRGSWFTRTVGIDDSSRVTHKMAEEVAARYGRDSSAYRVRVLGLFPLSDLDTVIPAEYVLSAQGRDIVRDPHAKFVWGVDCARYGDDTNYLIKRSMREVDPKILEWHGVSLMNSVGRIKAEWDATPFNARPTWILVDEIGLGAGVVDRLRELGLPTRGINVSEMASQKTQYMNLRTELWFEAREWLMKKDVSLPVCPGGCSLDPVCPHEMLASDLMAPKYDFVSAGKTRLEPKAATKKRLHRSPDAGDAFVLTFAVDAVTLLHGSSDGFTAGADWRKPIRYEVDVV